MPISPYMAPDSVFLMSTSNIVQIADIVSALLSRTRSTDDDSVVRKVTRIHELALQIRKEHKLSSHGITPPIRCQRMLVTWFCSVPLLDWILTLCWMSVTHHQLFYVDIVVCTASVHIKRFRQRWGNQLYMQIVLVTLIRASFLHSLLCSTVGIAV